MKAVHLKAAGISTLLLFLSTTAFADEVGSGRWGLTAGPGETDEASTEASGSQSLWDEVAAWFETETDGSE